MNSTNNIYSEFSKIFRATVSRGRFCLSIPQETTVYRCDWFYFPVRSIWNSKEWFSVKFLVRSGTRTTCTACLKKDTIPLYAYRQFIMYRLKIITHVYMKLWVLDNLVLFLYHSGIYIYIYIYIYILSISSLSCWFVTVPELFCGKALETFVTLFVIHYQLIHQLFQLFFKLLFWSSFTT